MNFTYLCTNYNNSDFTAAAVESLMACDVLPSRIVVVDNASRAEEVEKLTALAARVAVVDLILSDTNHGYFSGLNLGLDRLRETDTGDIVVLGNNDLLFPADFGSQLAGALPRIADKPVISPNVMTLDGEYQNPHVVSGISPLRELMYDLYYSNYVVAGALRRLAALTKGFTDRDDETHHAVAQFIHQGHGSVYLFTRRFFEMFDRLDAPTFMMGEEYFLSRQLEQKGWQVWYEPSIHVRHCCNGAIRSVPSRLMWEKAREAHLEYRKYVKPWRK